MSEEGIHEDALTLLKVSDRGGFAAEYSEVEGDLYAAQGMQDAASAAYTRALTTGQGEDQEYTAILRMKLADMGQEETVK
jgi:predicted negative regulator of RcsB-dependent stress response